MGVSNNPEEAFHAICADTMASTDPAFLHQHVVDAYFGGEGHDPDDQKPMRLWFALLGLCLHLEHGFDGRQVQRVHMQLAGQRRQWLPLGGRHESAGVTVHDVAAAAPEERAELVTPWCDAVWQSWSNVHDRVREIAGQFAGRGFG